MKNVLIISSTPRKGGNSDVLCDEFAKGAKESGNKVTKIRIADKASVKAGIKSGLEGLKGVVPGLVEIVVRMEGLASSNADVMLDSTFESGEALKGYVVHPAHVARPLATASRLALRARATRRLTARANVANGKVRPFTQTRRCLDYEV